MRDESDAARRGARAFAHGVGEVDGDFDLPDRPAISDFCV